MPNKNNKIDIGILDNADLIIGQYVSFMVTLTSDQIILPAKNIKINNNHSNNIKFDEMDLALNYGPDAKTATAKLGFTVLKEANNNTVKDGSPITFEVDTDASGFTPKKFAGKANEIDENSLLLFIDKTFLQVFPDGSKSPYTTAIYTTLKNKNTQRPLAGTPIYITSLSDHKMKDFIFKDAENNREIHIEKVGKNEGIFVSSDSKGSVKFYLHPKLSLVDILELRVIVLNTIYESYSKKIYVANYSNPGYMNAIGTPNILGYDPTGISADKGLSYFRTSIDNNDNELKIGDMILFFVNGNFTGHAISIDDPKNQLGNYSIKLPYSIFEQNVLSKFSYTVIKPTGDALYSDSLPVNYLGGIPYEPDPAVKRKYNPCIVHSSLGVGIDNIIQSGSGNYVSFGAIMNYPGYKYNGLFVEIPRSNVYDPVAITNPVPLNITEITLNMYINSENKNFQKSYTNHMFLNDIGDLGTNNTGANKDSIFFHIPYKDVVDVSGIGNISFDYQFNQSEELEYGLSWNAKIETIPDPDHENNQ
ncbi:hypothetical protein FE392_08140 [Xenorhabdus sp. 12]|uniref:Inverse autotransporter beta-domain domain-containing protein n=1 Tax=Xenorhabdus santafensis TaxID=2582833 RepID=A0ABU4S969_9GAMM|nr:hypothetical protein [Xenorhabdus sp. 12]MDX7987300.1 hypothetical protein [Xenorhabdus sp. 12]